MLHLKTILKKQTNYRIVQWVKIGLILSLISKGFKNGEIFLRLQIEISFKVYSTFDFHRWRASYWTLKGLGARFSFVTTHWLYGLSWPPVAKLNELDLGLLAPPLMEHSWILWFIFRHFIIRVTLFFIKCSKRFNKLFTEYFPYPGKDLIRF